MSKTEKPNINKLVQQVYNYTITISMVEDELLSYYGSKRKAIEKIRNDLLNTPKIILQQIETDRCNYYDDEPEQEEINKMEKTITNFINRGGKCILK